MALDDAYSVVLMHFRGAENSTSFIDESGKTWTQHGSAQLKYLDHFKRRTVGAFAGAGTKDYLSTPNSTDFDFGTGDFTIDLWSRRASIQGYGGLVCARSAAGAGWSVGFDNGNGHLRILNGADGVIIVTGSPTSAVFSSHTALVRYGNTLTLYVNGTSAGTYDCTGKSFPSSGAGLVIGRLAVDLDDYYYDGMIDEVRISKGIARWTGAFTPPTRQYRVYNKYLATRRDRFHSSGVSLG